MGEYLLAQSDVKILCTDYPDYPPMILSIRISIEHDNALKIAERTSLALQAKIKKEGKWQMGSEPFLSGQAQKKAGKVNRMKALQNENNIRAASMICQLRKEGLSYSTIADHLNKYKYRTSRGNDFSAIQVQRIDKAFC